MRKLVLLLALLLTGCATYSPEVTVLFGPKRVEQDTSPAATLMLMQRFGKHGVCGDVHSSDPSAGWPFNHNHDFSVNTAGCGLRWGGERQ